jgi:hypothetical protein
MRGEKYNGLRVLQYYDFIENVMAVSYEQLVRSGFYLAFHKHKLPWKYLKSQRQKESVQKNDGSSVMSSAHGLLLVIL